MLRTEFYTTPHSTPEFTKLKKTAQTKTKRAKKVRTDCQNHRRGLVRHSMWSGSDLLYRHKYSIKEESSSPWKYSLSTAVSGGRWRLCYDRGRTKHFWQQTQAFSALLPTALHKTHLLRTCPPEPNFVCVFHRLGYSRRKSKKRPSQAEPREPRLGKPLAPNI